MLLDEIKQSGRPIVVSMSGGKDSTATGLYLRELEIEKTNPVYYAFCDTGWEHPELYQYLDDVIEPLFGPEFYRLKSKKYPGGMPDLVEKKGMFPSRKIRFCTQELKIFPIRDFMKETQAKHPDKAIPLNVVGIRAAESKARSRMGEYEPGSILSGGKNSAPICDTWRPLITWLVQDVIDIHTRHGIRPCPLYLRDNLPAQRVGCWPCIMSRKDEIRSVAETDPDRIVQIRNLEKKVTDNARARHAKKRKYPDSPLFTATFFQSKGDDGSMWPIEKVVEWSKTAYGGRQYELFVANDPAERGCQSWGLCDLPDHNGEFSE